MQKSVYIDNTTENSSLSFVLFLLCLIPYQSIASDTLMNIKIVGSSSFLSLDNFTTINVALLKDADSIHGFDTAPFSDSEIKSSFSIVDKVSTNSKSTKIKKQCRIPLQILSKIMLIKRISAKSHHYGNRSYISLFEHNFYIAFLNNRTTSRLCFLKKQVPIGFVITDPSLANLNFSQNINYQNKIVKRLVVLLSNN